VGGESEWTERSRVLITRLQPIFCVFSLLLYVFSSPRPSLCSGHCAPFCHSTQPPFPCRRPSQAVS
jgi:hypothetical protein